MLNNELTVTAPGRICLLGEHQDYFGLPIIAAAINLRISIQGRKRDDSSLRVQLPDTGEEISIAPRQEIPYQKKRDYIRSTVNVLRKKGILLDRGWDCLISGSIPINSGTGSSSALVVAWTKFLLESVQDIRSADPAAIAELSFEAEVTEFSEPGGRMDHYSSAVGGVLAIHFEDVVRVNRLRSPLGRFVLADSGEKKDTTGLLNRIKNQVLCGVSAIQEKNQEFNLRSPLDEKTQTEIRHLGHDEQRLVEGTLLTREITAEGERLFKAGVFDHDRFGLLLTRQHEILRDYLQISTETIESMMKTALQHGALGAKINGSGGGGCLFAYAPHNADKVAQALESTGVKAYIIQVDDGVRRER